MGKAFAVTSTAVVTGVLTSAFWIFAYNTGALPTAEARKVRASGDVAVIDRNSDPQIAIAESIEVGPAGLAVPVEGIVPKDLTDTFTQARAGGARVHDAIDIMAAAGTPVIAATDGTVEKLYFSKGGGGITAYVRSPDQRWIYYYAHMQGYAPGLAEGQSVKRGQLIGRVGSTGNASADGPHLHFAINQMKDGDKWWQGTPINPYPLLAGKRTSG